MLLILCIGGAASAQQNPIERFYDKYQNDTNFTKIEFSGKMFEMANHIEAETDEEKEFLETFKMIEGVSVLAAEDFPNAKQEFRTAVKVPTSDFETLVSIEDKEGQAEVFIKESQGTVSEVLIVAGGEMGFAVVGIWGEISLNRLADITREIQLDMMKSYDGEAAQAGRDVTLFPNPVSTGNITLDIPAELNGGMVRIHDLNGRLITEKNVTAERIQLESSVLSNGTYIVSVSKGNNRVFTEQLVVQK